LREGGDADAGIAVVIAGLDPAIHPLRKEVLTKKMDPRVNPAGDGRFAWPEPGEGPTRAAIAVVIAGLDPAIHPLRKKSFAKRMDPRVKPAGDGR
jgi:hypothetical protein